MEQVTPERAANEMRRSAAAIRIEKPGDPYFEEVAKGNERIAEIIESLRADLAAARAEVEALQREFLHFSPYFEAGVRDLCPDPSSEIRRLDAARARWEKK